MEVRALQILFAKRSPLTALHARPYRYSLPRLSKTSELLSSPPLHSAHIRCQFKCDAVWNNGRGCYAFSQSDQHQIHRSMLRKTSALQKSKLNVGCGCATTDPGCLGETCSREASDEDIVVYINPAEPFERSHYEKYAEELEQRIETCRQEAFRRSTARWPPSEPFKWVNHIVIKQLN